MATRKPAQEFNDTTVSRRILVVVKREQTTATPRVVWRHEVPILEDVFGEGNVEEVDRATLDEGYVGRVTPDMLVHNKRQDASRRPSESAGLDFAFIGNPQGEYERLAMVYGKDDEGKTPRVEAVYGRFKAGLFARVLGAPKLTDLPPQQLRDLIVAFGYALPVATKDSTHAEKAAAADAHATFQGLEHADLVKLAGDVGVEIGA